MHIHSHSLNSQSHSCSPLVLKQVKKKPEAGSEEAASKPPSASAEKKPSASAEKKPAASKAPAKAAASASGGGGGGKGKAKGKAAVGKFDEPPDVPEPSIPVSGDGMFPLCVYGSE